MIAEVAGFERVIFLTEKTAEEMRAMWPAEDEPYYELEARGGVPKYFTGLVAGNIPFVDGRARVAKHFYVRQAIMRGCSDITSPEMKEKLRSRDLRSILLIRAAAFGDCTIMSPVFAALRHKYPDARIDVFGRKDSKTVYMYNPFLDNIAALRDVEVATLVPLYDDVFDMTHSIECNAQADYCNAVDVARDILMLDPLDDIMDREEPVKEAETRPCYIMAPEDIQKAAKMMAEMGLPPDVQGLVIIQAEATAQVRTLPYETSLRVAYALSEKGYTVLFVGHNPHMSQARLLRSSLCKDDSCTIAAVLPQGAGGLSKPCEKCDPTGEPREFRAVPQPPNIYFAQPLYFKYEPRAHFALAHFASLLITVDSFWGHMAAAIGKPGVMVFSNYHPHTRMKYYGDATLVAPDYEKDAPCGPCNALFDQCPMHPGKPPACIASIKAENIVDAALSRLRGERPLYQPMRDKPPALLNTKLRRCPVCGSFDDCEAVTCKGNHIYLRCNPCQSFFTQSFPDAGFWQWLPRRVKGNIFYRESRNAPVTEWLEVVKEICLGQDRPLPKQPIADLVQISDRFVGRKPYKEQIKGFCNERDEDSTRPIPEDLVLWVDGVMECVDVKVMLLNILNRMQGRYLAIISPMAERYSGNASWPPLHAPVAGMRTVIPAVGAIEKIVSKIGCATIVGSCTTEQSGLILVEKLREK